MDLNAAGTDFSKVVFYVLDLLYILIPILFSLAFIVFFWGLSKFILSSGNQADLQKGKDYMLWGTLALFILISFRAILSLVSTDLEFGGAKVIPLLKTGGTGNSGNNYNYVPPTSGQDIKLSN